MKTIKMLAPVLIVVSTLFTACKKDGTDPAPTPTSTDKIEGVWQGKYGFGNETPGVTYIFNIKPGGVIEELNTAGNSKGSGTWTLNGTTFTAQYQWKAPYNTIFKVSATFTKSTSNLSGTWGYDNSATDGGKWTMTKKN